MKDSLRPICSSPQMSIQTKTCPHGHVYLYVGHTCLFLQQEEFLHLAQVIQATERHLLELHGECTKEQQH